MTVAETVELAIRYVAGRLPILHTMSDYEYLPEHITLATKLGASWLDQSYPEWFEWIDLDTLSMDHMGHCVLGQAEIALAGKGDHPYADFLDTRVVDETEFWAVEHGFDIDTDADPEEYAYLDHAWRQLILERRDEKRQGPA